MDRMAAMKPQTGARAAAKFRLLMWKNFLLQWRHRKQTTVELLLPVLAMSLILVLRSQIHPFVENTITYPGIDAKSINFSKTVIAGMNNLQLTIAYSPKSKILEDVVRTAFARLIADNIYDIKAVTKDMYPDIEKMLPATRPSNTSFITSIIKAFVNVDAYNSSADLLKIYVHEEATRTVIAAVEFHDSLFGASELSKDLSYSLRFPEKPRQNSFLLTGGRSWRTALLYPAFSEPGPRFPWSWEGGFDPGYVNEMFIALQHCISTELISKSSGKNVRDYKIQIRRFPHPPFTYDAAILILKLLFPLINMLSFSYTAINITRSITLEKELQLKEAMKIMGLPTWLHWSAWFFNQFIFLFISTIPIVILLKVDWFISKSDRYPDHAVFMYTPWTILLFLYIMYLTCVVFLCFMVSSFFPKASTAAIFMGVIWFIIFLPSVLLAIDETLPKYVQVLLCLSANTAMSYGFQLILSEECTGAIQWDHFFYSAQQDHPRLLFGHVVVLLIIDGFIYMLVALYLEQVRPGPFGTPKPWNFLFRKDFWFDSYEAETEEVQADNINDNILREEDPKGHTVGVNIKNLNKMYGRNKIVNDFSLTIYNNQITVLLGPNGAGKSTIISMLTGNVAPTSGSIRLAGYDVRRQLREARAQVGLCPQHNVLFDELTVKEHLQFFGRLKGLVGADLHQEVEMLIEKLELQDKRDSQSGLLSGGQKRRLSVGIALCGGAKVVLLDEPTSGMDPSSRRALWDLLQKEKKGRAMILTTHFMDEADYLGDRIAIMSAGRLQCVGSPYFLKRHYGVGYILVVVKGHNFKPESCTEIINRYISGVDIKEDRGPEVTYALPNENSEQFEALLMDLEKYKNDIDYESYGLLATTIEDVFLSISSEERPQTSPTDNIDNIHVDERSVNPAIHCWHHIYAMWLKLWLVWSRSRGVLLLQIFVPIVFINITLAIVTFVFSLLDEIMPRLLTLEKGFTKTETLIAANDSSAVTQGLMTSYKSLFNSRMKLTLVEGQTIQDYYLNKSKHIDVMKKMRSEIVIGATFSADSIEAWFSNFGYHDVAISLATVHRALLHSLDPAAQLCVTNHPLQAHYDHSQDLTTIVKLLAGQFSQGLGNSVSIISAAFIMFYIRERVTGAKLLQTASGLAPAVMWGSAALFDWLSFVTVSLVFVLSCAIFNVMGLQTALELGRIYILIMVYGAAMLPFIYVLSLRLNGAAFGFVVVFFMNAVFGLIGTQIVDAIWNFGVAPVPQLMDGLLEFYPLYSLITSVQRIHESRITEVFCEKACAFITKALGNKTSCSKELMCKHSPNTCCARENPYFEWESPGVLRYLLCMLFNCILFWILLLSIEYGYWRKIYRFCRRRYTPPLLEESNLDNDVSKVIHQVKLMSQTELKQHNLVARGFTKHYKNDLAVNQVSFCVEDKECFGLLGANGAGKTTTFKMLMGDEMVSSGDAFVRGHSVIKDIKEVHKNIGYCPQFDAVFDELTGRENLRLFALLRGLKPETVDSLTQQLADSLGFTEHLDKRVVQYSGGNKRKLSTAVALMGHARVVFLDEPTTGVDPAARRQVWTAIRKATQSGKSVVLTSHSMEECEALCSRLTIMVNGQFKCLGTPQHLKNKFSEGFTLTIKLKLTEDTTVTLNQTAAIKDFVNTQFTSPKLMEEYQGLLTYYLSERSMPWSRMFGIMERAKRELHVEDYSISQTTLEQIFLRFTKYQRDSVIL